ncbi:MAG: VanZ family protein [Flavobacteriales bacterium]
MSKVQRILRILLVLEFVGICYLSLKSPNGGIHVQLNDKVGHFIGYGILSLNTFLVFGFRSRWHTLFILLFLVGWGVLMECLQGFVPGREVSGLDIVANTIGVAIGTSLYFWWKRY